MATEIRPASWRQLYGETLTMGANPKALIKPPGARAVRLSTGTACTIQLCPALRLAWTYIGTTYTDVTANLVDKDTSTVLAINDFATTSILYLGSNEQFRGVYVNVTNTNTNNAVIDAEYYNGTAWTDLTETDNTVGTGKSLNQDGDITWTMPTDWAITTVNSSASMYWVRFKWNATLDDSVNIAELMLLSKESNRGNFLANNTVHELGLAASVGAIEAVESGGATLTVTWLLP